MLALEVEVAPITPGRCRVAFSWAEKLGQARAYDSFYLALAEELETTFITADKRLANGARQRGLSWVRWIGDN
jgi:predicted nucleic acid-binding protein